MVFVSDATPARWTELCISGRHCVCTADVRPFISFASGHHRSSIISIRQNTVPTGNFNNITVCLCRLHSYFHRTWLQVFKCSSSSFKCCASRSLTSPTHHHPADVTGGSAARQQEAADRRPGDRLGRRPSTPTSSSTGSTTTSPSPSAPAPVPRSCRCCSGTRR